MMTQNTCACCRFWDTSHRAGGYGDCRANAPVAGTEDRWPVSEVDDWCGQWQATNSQPTPNDRQIRSSLVDRVDQALTNACEDSPGSFWAPEAHAAIREVAVWMRSQDLSTGDYWAGRLEQEAER